MFYTERKTEKDIERERWVRGVWGNGNYRIGECPWVKKYLECRNLAGPLIRAGIIPAVI